MPNKFNNITITKIMDNNNHVLVQCGEKNKSINSELPLEFTSDGQNLEDYRIYGNTGGVGDRCNLFNKDNADITTAFPDPSTGQLKIEQSYGDSPKSVIIAVAPNTTYTIQIGKLPLVFTRSAEYTSYPQVGDAGTLLSTTATLESNTSYGVSFTTSATAAYIVWYFSWNATESELQSKLDSMMLSKGNVLKNYKTYDEYQIPVVINGNTISFQIDEPLQFNQSISLLDTNINIPTINGINTLTIATDVKPQNLMIKGNVEYIDSGESIIYTISYYSQDGQTLIRTEKVLKYGNAMDLQNEPTKESTAQYNYTFVGWNMSANQTTATSGVLNNITSDKTVYAAFSESVRTYTVYFYNEATLLQTVQNVPYGGSATYTGTEPTKTDYEFTGWNPQPTNIIADTSCYDQFEQRIQGLITDSWATISQRSAAGTAQNYYSVGDCKPVYLNGTMGTVALDDTLYVYILGFNHNSAKEGTGITFGGFKTGYTTSDKNVGLCDTNINQNSNDGSKWFSISHYGNNNYGGWMGCDLRYDILGSTDTAPSGYGSAPTTSRVGYNASSTCATHPVANTLMSCLPSSLRAVMKPITKYTDNTGNKSNAQANVTASIDYLPLLSEYEVHGARTHANQYEQNNQLQYAYYSAGNAKAKYRYNDTSSSVAWWLRSPEAATANGFCNVHGTHGNAYTYTTYSSRGVAPIFLV